VWDALLAIGCGETTDYGSLGARIGRPGAARAVGRANATNPIPIVIPCHRVIGRDGSPTGYAGGVEAKVRLLALEGVGLAPAARRATEVAAAKT
jgi:methylated-DNA-[protein]-cysteine S-methyltransferase